jgi:glucokinase-like ROK family protein
MQKATRQQTKEHNRNLVLKTIFEHDSISRAEIARVTSLTRTTVSDIVADLIGENLVTEVGVGSSIGGKSPILLSLAADSRFLIGLDLAYNQFCGAVINLRGQIKKIVNLPVNSRNGEKTLAQVYEIIDQLMQDQYRPLVGIGVGTPGLVNSKAGVVVNAVNLDWKDLPLASLLQARYQLPVYVLNDSQAAAMGEYTYGEGRKAENNLVVINVRHGIGAGFVINNQLFQGDGGWAGEIGHVVVIPDGGLRCRCGNRGCLETVASAQAIVRRAQELARHSDDSNLAEKPDSITFASIEQAFVAGDPLARQVVLEAGYYMGIAISSLIGTLNIRKIVLSGDMTRFGKPWLDIIRETASRSSLSRLVQETKIEIGQLESNRIVLGATGWLLSDYALLFRN